MGGIGSITALVIECADAPALARFWSDVLGVAVTESAPAWASLSHPGYGRIAFQSVEAYQPPDWPGRSGAQQMHLDVLVTDLESATTQALERGATVLSEVLDPGPEEWRILADPAGHPFCLVTVPE